MAHQAGAYPGFRSMKLLLLASSISSPPDGMLIRRRVNLSIKFAGTHLHTWVGVKCLAQEHNTMSLLCKYLQNKKMNYKPLKTIEVNNIKRLILKNDLSTT